MTLPQLIPVLLTTYLLALPTCGFATSLIDQSEPAPLNLSLGLGLHFESGTYETGNNIETWKVPLRVEWAPQERRMLILESPASTRAARGGTVLIGGTPTPIRRGNGTLSGTGTGTGTGTDGTGTTADVSSDSA